jgi:NADPH-dependent ferric siderophore reductase
VSVSAVADDDAIPTHVTEVVRSERVNGSFVRITFGGGLDRFRPLGPDDFVYVLLPPPGRAQLPIDTSFRWADYDEMAEEDRPVGAYYTVRRSDLLAEAVRDQAPPTATTYAWGGAESRAMTAVRRYLRREVGLAREQVSMTPYWRHASHAEDPIDADD